MTQLTRPVNFTIRPFDRSELADLRSIYNAARADAGCFHGGPATAVEFAALIHGEEIFVAECAVQLVGFVSVWAPDNFIHHLYVLPTFQAQGIGSGLLQYCELRYGRALSLKCSVVNGHARRFYQRKGWVANGAGIGDDGPWEHLFLT